MIKVRVLYYSNVGLTGVMEMLYFIYCSTDIITAAILLIMEWGRLFMWVRSSFIIVSSGVKFRANNSDSLMEMLMTRYLMLPVATRGYFFMAAF